MTLRFGVISVSRVSSSSVADRVEEDADVCGRECGPGVVGMTHSSSVTLGELAADEDTSPRLDGCFFRIFFVADRVFVDGVPIMLLEFVR